MLKMERDGVLSQNMRDYSKGLEIMQNILICVGALVVPTFLAKLITIVFGANSYVGTHSQIIVGTIVNVSLIVSAINVKGLKKIMRYYYVAKHLCRVGWICV